MYRNDFPHVNIFWKTFIHFLFMFTTVSQRILTFCCCYTCQTGSAESPIKNSLQPWRRSNFKVEYAAGGYDLFFPTFIFIES